MTTVAGYLRVSTDGQAESGLGLEAQRAAIAGWALGRGVSVVWIEDAASGKSLKREGVQSALAMLKKGEVSALVVAKLDRLSRSVHDFAGLLKLSDRQGWGIVALDLGVDTTTPTGKLVANVVMSVAEWEREMIGVRTADALAAKRRKGHEGMVTPEVRAQILAMHADGLNASAIARHLTADGVPTARGGAWAGSVVSRIIRAERRLAA